jgi:hypothetical protein
MYWRVGGGNQSIEFCIVGGELRDQGTLSPCLVLSDTAQQFTSLCWARGHGSHMIQKVWSRGPQSCLARNTHLTSIPRGRFQSFQVPPSVFLPLWKKAMEIMLSPKAWNWGSQSHLAANTPQDVVSRVGVNAFRHLPAVQLLVGHRGGCVNYMIQRVLALGFYLTCLAANTHNQEAELWKLSTKSARDLMLCVCHDPQGMGVASPQGEHGFWTSHPSLPELMLLEFLYRSMLALLPLHIHHHCYLLPRHCVRVSQDSLSHDCSLYSNCKSISASNHRPSLKMAPCYSSLRQRECQNVFPHQG